MKRCRRPRGAVTQRCTHSNTSARGFALHKHVAVEFGRGFRGVASKVIDAYNIHCCSLCLLGVCAEAAQKQCSNTSVCKTLGIST